MFGSTRLGLESGRGGGARARWCTAVFWTLLFWRNPQGFGSFSLDTTFFIQIYSFSLLCPLSIRQLFFWLNLLSLLGVILVNNNSVPFLCISKHSGGVSLARLYFNVGWNNFNCNIINKLWRNLCIWNLNLAPIVNKLLCLLFGIDSCSKAPELKDSRTKFDNFQFKPRPR